MELEFEYTTKLFVICDPEKGSPNEGTRDSLNICNIHLGGEYGLLVFDSLGSDQKRAELDKIEEACWEQIRFLQEVENVEKNRKD